MPANIFVLGLDELNLTTLRRMRDVDRYRFHPLLSVEELLQAEEIRLTDLLAKAEAQLDAFPDRIDALIGYWDFPVSSMVPILRQRLGLPGPSLAAVVTCEHKYWCRLVQQQVISELPRFGLVDPADPGAAPPDGLAYPLWVKPVKSFASELAFRAADDAQWRAALAALRAGIARVGEPFDLVLDRLELPPEIARAGGQTCLVEEALEGLQVTVEGYRYHGDVHIYGVVDSVRFPGSSSFLRYEYPSRLPPPVQHRVSELTATVIDRIGLDETAFNVEYFWDPVRDTVALLEVNPRPSQSHARLFADVDGVPNHQCLVRLALGRDPQLPHRAGPYRVAAKWFLRRFTDGLVTRVPTATEIARTERAVPGTAVEVVARPGVRLSDLHRQDSYSYELGHVYVGAADDAELQAKYERCVAELPFEFAEVETGP